MNNLLHKICLLAFLALMWGCKKETSFNGTDDINLFTENLTSLKKGEPVLLSFATVGSTIPVWTITPNTNVSVNTVGNFACIEFKKAGKYTIIASAAGKQGTYIANVIDSSFHIAGSNFALVANSLVNIMPFSPVEFTVQNPHSSTINWTFSNNASNTSIASNQFSAQASFGTGVMGATINTGTVKATDGINTQSRTVWLNSTPSATHKMVPFLFTDKLLITPSVVTDTGGNKILVLKAKTQLSYQCNNDVILNLSTNTTNSGYIINYGGVNMSKTICPTKEPATTTSSFSNMPMGVHPFTINFGNKTMVGSITVLQGGVFNFNWNNNSDVTINPLTVQ